MRKFALHALYGVLGILALFAAIELVVIVGQLLVALFGAETLFWVAVIYFQVCIALVVVTSLLVLFCEGRQLGAYGLSPP